jgi:glycosyltransferase involved in cell wall biosynthesis
MKIWILDPYHAGSHADWACGIQSIMEKAGHAVNMHVMPGRHWKWRMHAAAAHFASQMEATDAPDLVLTTDMCDVAQLRGLMPSSWNRVRVVTMFHENQLTFPWSPSDSDVAAGRDQTYAYLNISSALASDEVWFNSEHHRTAFLSAVQRWMKRMPKPHIPALAKRIGPKSRVMHLGLDFTDWDGLKPTASTDDACTHPVILWNHRWSWDKGAEDFVRFVDAVVTAELPASFVILGEDFERRPEGWDAMRDKLGSRCLQWGYADSKDDYVRWLWRSDVAPVHPKQEYFGLSIVEAMRCEVIPWVPNAHAYPETTPEHHPYLEHKEWIKAMQAKQWTQWPLSKQAYRTKAMEFDWQHLGDHVVRVLESLLDH